MLRGGLCFKWIHYLPPASARDAAILEYYKNLDEATGLPLIVQSQNEMSVDLIVELHRQGPAMKCVTDEAGDPLQRVRSIIERTRGEVAVFSGNGVRTMIDDMFGRIQACKSLTGASSYTMVIRGVFKESRKMRGSRAAPLDDRPKSALREAWDEFMKPYVKG